MAEMKFACPECKQPLEVDEDAAGQSINCPACSKPITIPPPVPLPAQDDAAGLLGFLEQFFRRMIWGVFRFIFVDSPQKIVRFLVQSFPWIVRLVRVILYAAVWICLTFWPLLVANYAVRIGHQSMNGLREYVQMHGNQVSCISYIWSGICIVGSLWGLAKWSAIHRARKHRKLQPSS